MKWKSVFRQVLCLVAASIFTFVPASVTEAVNVTLVSDTTWTVSDAMGNFLGNAQTVCLSANLPVNCPPGAMLYGYPLFGWAADLSSIPGATWIWAPNITGTTAGAANAEFTFQKEFYLCGTPQNGTIHFAADNEAEIFLNGVSIASSTLRETITTIPVPASSLAQGLNIIQVKAVNAANPAFCTSGQYQCNPAGLVFGASFADALNAWPTCTSQGNTYTVGQFESLSCPAGQTGSRMRPCICFGSNGVWGPTSSTCAAPPPPPVTCTGNSATYSVGATETLSCPAGQTGSMARTCQANGTWGATTSTCATPPPPPVTCVGANGTRFNVGGVESFACPAGQVGSRTRTCQSNGNWSSISSTCTLPTTTAGAICGSSQVGQTAICPAGTTCGPRQSPRRPEPDWCFLFAFSPIKPNECQRGEIPQTTDWFCDP